MELFFFDRGFVEELPKADGAKFEELLRKIAIPQGRPFFLSGDGLPLRDLDGLCGYLLDPQRASSKTWATYANQIAVFLRFLDRQGKDWKEATREDLNLYFSVRTTGEFQSSPKLKARSWNVVKSAIVLLYEYGLEHGYITDLPFKYRKSRTAFGGRLIQTSDLGAKFTPERINFISVKNYKELWRRRISFRRNSQRNLALCDLLITVGLRISEALGLQTHQIPDPDNKVYAGRKSVPIRVQGKGSKARAVMIPKRIARAIHFYMEEDREDALRALRHRKGLKVKPSKYIFLSEIGSVLKARTVQELFSKGQTHRRVYGNLQRLLEAGQEIDLAHPDLVAPRNLAHGHSDVTQPYTASDALAFEDVCRADIRALEARLQKGKDLLALGTDPSGLHPLQ